MATVSEIIDDIFRLPRADRGYLAQKLIESLDDEGELTDEEKAALERRSRELNDGTVTPLSLDRLRQQVRARLG
ncbi:MAG: addiction module protein [Akkermansiaceae bacterium]|nr:addiction module protein [Akkermansiaceae bacterium]